MNRHQLQTQPKHETGTCPVCWGEFRIQKRDGTLYKHGHGGGGTPCAGSYKTPNTTSVKSTAAASQAKPVSSRVSSLTQATTDRNSNPLSTHTETLQHPEWTATINHIPRASRNACAKAFACILKKVIESPNDISAWRSLLNFGPSTLAKPSRGGASRNLNNIINKRLTNSQTTTNHLQPTGCHRNANRNVNSDDLRIAATREKLEAGNFRAAVRILCSDDKPAPVTLETLQALRAKHPPAPLDRSVMPPNADNIRFSPLQVSQEDVLKCVKTFPAGSSGGPDGFTPQHLKDLLSGTADAELATALTDFINILLVGDLPLNVREIIFGARLIALQKKDGGIRPIAVGYTLRRLAAKCANRFVIQRRSEELSPVQIGVGVAGGAEAAVHATRRLLRHIPDDHVFVKLDFSNAFNSVRRDLILQSAAEKTPEIYRFIHASLTCNSKLTYGNETIISAEGAQQGDPLGSLEFCEAIHPTLLAISPGVTLSYIDDVNLEGEASKVATSVQAIVELCQETGLQLNAAKCEITANNLHIADRHAIFRQFKRVSKADLTLLGAPVMGSTTADRILNEKTVALEHAVDRLSLLTAHDALCLLKNSIAMPKLLYTLRTTPCFGSPILEKFDQTLRSGLSRLLNVDLSNDQWKQASLPVHKGGLGVRSACMLAPSAFLASAAATLALQEAILIPTKPTIGDDESVQDALSAWHTMTDASEPSDFCRRMQRAWDEPVAKSVFQQLLSTQTLPIDQARLRAIASPHAGDWLHAPPITAVGLRLSNEDIRIAVAYRLGAAACQPHDCRCGTKVDARGLHGLSCRKSEPRHIRHSQLNDTIWRAVKRAKVPATKEPVGLLQSDGLRPDGVTLLPWSRGKPVAWDVTVPDTFAASHVDKTTKTAGAAAETAAANKMDKYSRLAMTHLFIPIAIETGGAWCSAAIKFIQDLGHRITEVTEEPLETTYLFQRISMVIQRGNSLSFHNTFQPPDSCTDFSPAAS